MKPKRPTDVNQRAKSIVDIATGEKEDSTPSKKAAAGQKGGVARSKSISSSKRSEIATKAANKRWNK